MNKPTCCGLESIWVDNVPGKEYYYCKECKNEVNVIALLPFMTLDCFNSSGIYERTIQSSTPAHFWDVNKDLPTVQYSNVPDPKSFPETIKGFGPCSCFACFCRVCAIEMADNDDDRKRCGPFKFDEKLLLENNDIMDLNVSCFDFIEISSTGFLLLETNLGARVQYDEDMGIILYNYSGDKFIVYSSATLLPNEYLLKLK